MAILQRPLFGHKDMSKEMYDKPLEGFIQTRTEITQKHSPETTKSSHLQEPAEDLEKKCSLGDSAEKIGGESSTESEGDESGDESGYESEEKIDPAEKKAARKEHKKKVKEEKREARKTKIPKADKKRRKKLAKAKCSR